MPKEDIEDNSQAYGKSPREDESVSDINGSMGYESLMAERRGHEFLTNLAKSYRNDAEEIADKNREGPS